MPYLAPTNPFPIKDEGGNDGLVNGDLGVVSAFAIGPPQIAPPECGHQSFTHLPLSDRHCLDTFDH